MNFELRQSERKAAKIRLSLQGPPGSGKSMSALLIAKGLTGDWKKITAYDIDQMIPFSVWRNNDLWNLLPSQATTNSQKRDKIPAVSLIERRKD